jgi:hypothetical protein
VCKVSLNISSVRTVGRKMALLSIKILLGFISFAFVDEKSPKFVPDFVKSFNETIQSKTNDL